MKRNTIFLNRQDAGQKLATLLMKYSNENPLVLGIPRGGVIIAYEIAKKLKAELGVIVARKIGAPGNPEFAIGAIAPKGIIVWNDEAIEYFGLDEETKKKFAKREEVELARRMDLFCPRINLEKQIHNRTVIIVDDGLATGMTALATVLAARKMQAKKVVFAFGVCASDSAKMLAKEVDELICFSTPNNLEAVGKWYEDFSQVTDEEVLALLNNNSF